ncbi:hypothetical protein VTL71DRAFT_13850 [Oculimacula yallundae]|uniref:SET domain-containing protein n=1 Tax=Oculimacula yallundae TaxID=86028 RepID=A0ABR4CLL2_9HELO
MPRIFPFNCIPYIFKKNTGPASEAAPGSEQPINQIASPFPKSSAELRHTSLVDYVEDIVGDPVGQPNHRNASPAPNQSAEPPSDPVVHPGRNVVAPAIGVPSSGESDEELSDEGCVTAPSSPVKDKGKGRATSEDDPGIQGDDDGLPLSRRRRLTMFAENTDPNQGPEYVSPDQLFEIRERVCGPGRGLFAAVNIKDEQVIMSDESVVTLCFYKDVPDLANGKPCVSDRVVSYRLDEIVNRSANGENASRDHVLEETQYIAGDDVQTQVRKRLIADYGHLTESNSMKADVFKHLYPDPLHQYGGDWLLRVWQRYSRTQVPPPCSIDLKQLQPAFTTIKPSTEPHDCSSLFQKINYINHCCFPNADLCYDSVLGGRSFAVLRARGNILRNDEITIDFDDWDMPHEVTIPGFEDINGDPCDCEVCLGGYKDPMAWFTRD